MSTVLHAILQLLAAGHTVRTTVRHLQRSADKPKNATEDAIAATSESLVRLGLLKKRR